MIYASKKIILHTLLFLISQHLYSNESIFFEKIAHSMKGKIGDVNAIKAVGIIAALGGTRYIISRLNDKINKMFKLETMMDKNKQAVPKKFQWKCAIKRSALKTLLTSPILIVALTNAINKEWPIAKGEYTLLYAYMLALQSFQAIYFDKQYGLVAKIIKTQVIGRCFEEKSERTKTLIKDILLLIPSCITFFCLIEILLEISNNEAIKFIRFLSAKTIYIFFDLLTNNYFTTTYPLINKFPLALIKSYLLPDTIYMI